MAPRGTGESNNARMASPSRSRSNVRPRPTVPEMMMVTHRMPAVTGAEGGVPPTTKAKLKIRTTTTARKALVNRISRLLHSMARSLAAMRAACATNRGGRAPRRPPHELIGASPRSRAAGSPARGATLPPPPPCWVRSPTSPITAALLVGRPHRFPAPDPCAAFIPHQTPSAQDDQVLGQRAGGLQIVRHQDHDAPGVALPPELAGQPGSAGGIESGARLVEEQDGRLV